METGAQPHRADGAEASASIFLPASLWLQQQQANRGGAAPRQRGALLGPLSTQRSSQPPLRPLRLPTPRAPQTGRSLEWGEGAASFERRPREERFNCLVPSVRENIKQTRRMKRGAQ